MIIGPIVDSGVAESRDHVDVTITVRLHAASYVEGRSSGRAVSTEEWSALKDTLRTVVAKGNEVTLTTREPAADIAEEKPVSPALARFMEREEARDDAEAVAVEMSDTGSDGWDLSDDDSDGREDE